MSRILVTGSRDWTDYDTICRGMTVAIETVIADRPDDFNLTLVHGNAKGADLLTDKFMRNARKFLATKGYNVLIEIHNADWDTWGKSAGPIRNKAMVDAGADVVVAFIKNNSRGATHCLGLAEKAGIKSLVYKA
jgi:hypothetical protein